MPLLDTESPDVRVAVFGRQVEDFLASDVGLYVQQCAEIEETEAKNALALVDPEDAAKVRKLQNDVLVARKVISWLAEAVQKGHEAIQVLEDQ